MLRYVTEAAMTATDRRWRNSGGHGRLIDVEEAYYVCRNACGGGSVVWDWGLLERELNEGHVELLQLKAHEQEAPREGLGGTGGALSWYRGQRARRACCSALVRRDRTLLCEAPPATGRWKWGWSELGQGARVPSSRSAPAPAAR